MKLIEESGVISEYAFENEHNLRIASKVGRKICEIAGPFLDKICAK